MKNDVEIKKGQSVLLVRYSSKIIEDCMKRHKDVADKEGFCWYAMLGMIPSDRIISAALDEENPTVVMLGYNKVHICKLATIEKKIPENHYPEYYNDLIFSRNQRPGCFLKLENICETDEAILHKLYVMSSGRTVYDIIHNHCQSPFLLVSYDWIDETKLKKKPENKSCVEKLGINECIYRDKNGKCGRKTCVSYTYECENPSDCSKQKR